MKSRVPHADEDYGDYITRCICSFTHDDGYMICCDECSVWQHVECVEVDPKNLPDKYLCEECEPRQVDRKRAKLIQIKKREEMTGTDGDDDGSVSADDGRSSGTGSPTPSGRKKKRQKPAGTLRVQELKAEARKNKREKEDVKKGKKKSKHFRHQSASGSTTPTAPTTSILSGVQTLLTAASALEQQQEHQFSSNNLWSSTVSPWNDPHQNINSNQYSESLLSSLSSSLSQLKQEAVVYTTREFQQIGPHPLCLVREVYPARKGVVSEANIPEDEMIMEYKGFITTRQDVMVELNITSIKLLWQSKPSPFIYQYDKMSNLNICIDARHYGNFARFIRRSCSPNAELRHFFVENEVHFGIYAIHHISPGEEVTIGFDFPHDKCHYPVECACGHKTTCLLNGPRGYVALRGKRPHREVCGSESEIFQEDRHPNHSRKVKSRLLSSSNSLNEDSNSSWTSNTNKRTRQNSTSHSQQASESESDENSLDSDVVKRRKSREERKTEAVWKMFEKMEATHRRRQQHVVTTSENNHDNGDLHSPSSFHSTPRVKERTSSNGRKVQLLSSGKSCLTNMSNLLSPEPVDNCSPPLTPSLSISSLHEIPPSTYSSVNDQFSSPLWGSSKLTFEVTPYLHPKYLLADFALPRKKAILRQWEMEQVDELKDMSSSNGFTMACVRAMESKATRSKGNLKHRWIMEYNGTENNCQKELPMYHKKKFLQKWEVLCKSLHDGSLSRGGQLSKGDKTLSQQILGSHEIHSESSRSELSVNQSKSLNQSESMDQSLTQSVDKSVDEVTEGEGIPHPHDQEGHIPILVNESEDRVPPVTDISAYPERLNPTSERQKEPSSPDKPDPSSSHPSSPLFENFSDDDDDFDEDTGSNRTKPLKDLVKEKHDETNDDNPIIKPSIGLVTQPISPTPSPVSMVTDIAMTTDPVTTETGSSLQCETTIDANVSEETSEQPITSLHSALEPAAEVGEVNKPPDVVTSPVKAPESVALSPRANEDTESIDDVMEMELSTPPSTCDKHVDVIEPQLEHDPLSFASSSLVTNDESRPSLDDDRDKKSSKRKVSLLEYRSRSRKPPDNNNRKPNVASFELHSPPISSSVSITSTTPSSTSVQITSPTKSFLSFSSSFLNDTSMANRANTGSGSEPGSHFEPVSPDENESNDNTVKQVPLTASLAPAAAPTTPTMPMMPSTYPLPIPANTVMPSLPIAQQYMWPTAPLPPPPTSPLDLDPRRIQMERFTQPGMAPPPHYSYPVMHQIMSPEIHQPRPVRAGGFVSHPPPRPPILPPTHAPHHSNNYY